MSTTIEAGIKLRHIHLKDSPELYVVKVIKEKIQCRYFSNGLFHLEEFEPEELLTENQVTEFRSGEQHRQLLATKSNLDKLKGLR